MIKRIVTALFLRDRGRSLSTLLDAGILEDYSLRVRGGHIYERAVLRIPDSRTRINMTGAGAAGIARMEGRR